MTDFCQLLICQLSTSKYNLSTNFSIFHKNQDKTSLIRHPLIRFRGFVVNQVSLFKSAWEAHFRPYQLITQQDLWIKIIFPLFAGFKYVRFEYEFAVLEEKNRRKTRKS